MITSAKYAMCYHSAVALLVCVSAYSIIFIFFFFNDTATTEIYTLSLHDALPIFRGPPPEGSPEGQGTRRSCPRGATALVRQGLHAGRGGPHVARRGGTGLARGGHDLLFLRGRLQAHGPPGRQGRPRGEGARGRAARSHADPGTEPRHLLRLAPPLSGPGQGRGGRPGCGGPSPAAPVPPSTGSGRGRTDVPPGPTWR